MKRWIKITIAIVVVLLVLGGSAWLMQRNRASDDVRTATVQRGALIREITFTGELTAVQTAELAAEYGGVVRQVPVAEGDTVSKGTVLAQLDTAAAQLEAAKAAADLNSTQAAARLAWENAQRAAENTKKENARSVEQQKQLVRNAQADIEDAQHVWQARVDESGEESSLARTAFASYTAAQHAYTSAQKTLQTLLATVAKSNEAATAAAQAAEEDYVATTQSSGTVAGLSSLEALQQQTALKLGKLAVTAPFDGTVTDVAVAVGEYATSGQTVATLQTVDDLKVVADVTETDAAKVAAGMSATVVFDALPDMGELAAGVVGIAPAARIIEGVPTYQVTLRLTHVPAELKPGLTADITVHADRRENVLIVPRRAVTVRDGKEIVQVRSADGNVTEATVVTGLVGSDGHVEIVEGLAAGQVVVVSAPNAD